MVDVHPIRSHWHAFVVQMNWIEVLRGIFVSLEKDFLASLTAVLGTTTIPYLLFWQPEEEVEQMNSEPKEKPLVSGK
jgi:Mn2+/Fe2+ NRAMP family transporter